MPFASFSSWSSPTDPLAPTAATQARVDALHAALSELADFVDPSRGPTATDLASLSDELLSAYGSLADERRRQEALPEELAQVESRLFRAIADRFETGVDTQRAVTLPERLLFASIVRTRSGIETTDPVAHRDSASPELATRDGSSGDLEAAALTLAIERLDADSLDRLGGTIARTHASGDSQLACLLFLLVEQRLLRTAPAPLAPLAPLFACFAQVDSLVQNRFFDRYVALVERFGDSSTPLPFGSRRSMPRVLRRLVARQGQEPEAFACDTDVLIARETLPHLRDDHFDALLAHDDVHPQVLETLARRFPLDEGRRLALLRHPACPMPLANRLLHQLESAELREIVRTSRHPDVKRRAMLVQIQRRTAP